MAYINPIDNLGYDQILFKNLGGLRRSAIDGEVPSAARTKFVPPGKPTGSMTQRQHETNGDASRAAESIARNGKSLFSEILPPPPSGSEMVGFLKQAGSVPEAPSQQEILGHHEKVAAGGKRVKNANPPPPTRFSSQVLQAYKQGQSPQGLNIQSQAPLHQLFA